MDEDRFIKEAEEYLSGIPSDWKPTEFFGKQKIPEDADENYVFFLEALNACSNGGKWETYPKSSRNSQEQICEDQLDTENTEEDVDCDVSPGVTEDEYTEGVDLNRRLMGSVEEEDDPDLKVFLQNLKPRGFACVFELSIENITKQRKYEDEDEDEDENVNEIEQPDEPRRKVSKSNPSSRIAQPTRKKNVLLKELGDLDNEVTSISPTHQAKNKCAKRNTRYSSSTNHDKKASDEEKNKAPIPRRSSRKVVRKTLVEDSSSDESQEEEIQPQRHMVSRNLPKIREPLNESPPEKHSKKKKERERERLQAPLPEYCEETNLEFRSGLETVGCSPVNTCNDETPIPRRSSRKVVRRTLVEDSSSDEWQEEEIQPKRHVVSRNPAKIREPLNESPPEKHSIRKKEKERERERVQAPFDEYHDESYLEFLSGLKMVGYSPVYKYKNGDKCKYDEYTDWSTSDSDVEALTSKPSKKRLKSSESISLTPKPSKKRIKSSESNSLISKPNKKSSQLSVVIEPSSKYRKKLMDILLKPYDGKEHRDLLKELTDRKPVMHHRDMRGGNCSYPDKVLVAKSYLDRYQALAVEIEAVQPDEPHKVLHLLRGLSFYLQNVCMENSFMPWNDKSWIEAVRKSKYH